MKRPRIEGYAVISKEGMIATSDGNSPRRSRSRPTTNSTRTRSRRRRRSSTAAIRRRADPKEHERRRIILTRRVDVLTPDPDNPNAILWNPATAPFDEAWARLGIDGGVAAVVGGTDTFGLFLTIGYDVFYLTRTEASVPRGRPSFPASAPRPPPKR